jgi:hypothetical protein
MGLDLSSGVGRLPLSNGLDPNTRKIDPNPAASMKVQGSNHVVDGLFALL